MLIISPAWRIAISGLIALSVAMGIGRFAFTPLLPMMLHDGAVDLQSGGWLATANYIGYFFGALSCMAIRWQPTRMIRWGLGMTALLTMGMGIPMAAQSGVWLSEWNEPLWIVLRAASGVASSWVVVFGSGWCLVRLTELGMPRLGGIIYCGPGIGILGTGVLAASVSAIGWKASSAWIMFGLFAFVLSALIWNTFRSNSQPLRSAGPGNAPVASGSAAPYQRRRLVLESRLLVFAYGLSGFGYIITATFLPVIARDAMPHSHLHDVFWPLFGACVALGAWLAVFIPVHVDQRRLLSACYLMQAAGVLASVIWPSLLGFGLGSILLGLPFTAITLFAMREAHRLTAAIGGPANRLIGLLTASFGLGQIAGPPLATQLVKAVGTFTPSLLAAAGALVIGAIVLFMLSTMPPESAQR